MLCLKHSLSIAFDTCRLARSNQLVKHRISNLESGIETVEIGVSRRESGTVGIEVLGRVIPYRSAHYQVDQIFGQCRGVGRDQLVGTYSTAAVDRPAENFGLV